MQRTCVSTELDTNGNAEGAKLFRLQKLVQMHHHIFHFGIVHRTLGSAAPRFFRAGVIRKHADDIQFFQIGKFEHLRVFNPPAKYQVQFCVTQMRAPFAFSVFPFVSSPSAGLQPLRTGLAFGQVEMPRGRTRTMGVFTEFETNWDGGSVFLTGCFGRRLPGGL